MFKGATSFTSDLSGWNVGQVTNMASMFMGASTFDGSIGNWITERVTAMNNMFNGASSFNRDLTSWSTARISNLAWMFFEASAFNGDVSTFDVSQVTDMRRLFSKATVFNGGLSAWDVCEARGFKPRFLRGSSNRLFERSTPPATARVTNFGNMFDEARAFAGQGLSSWNVGKAQDIGFMFNQATVFNADLSTWDVSKSTSLAQVFAGTAFNGNISSWNTARVNSLRYTFYGAGAFNGDISRWDTSLVQNLDVSTPPLFRHIEALFPSPSRTLRTVHVPGCDLLQRRLEKLGRLAVHFNGGAFAALCSNFWSSSEHVAKARREHPICMLVLRGFRDAILVIPNLASRWMAHAAENLPSGDRIQPGFGHVGCQFCHPNEAHVRWGTRLQWRSQHVVSGEGDDNVSYVQLCHQFQRQHQQMGRH